MVMSKHPSNRPPPQIDTIVLRPPKDTEDTPPPFANNVRVIGSADAMTVHLYFVSPTRLVDALEKRVSPGLTVRGNVLTIETEPVARVALPVSTATELALSIMTTIAENASEFQGQLGSMVARFAETMAALEEAKKAEGED